MKVREHRGSLAESMATARETAGRQELLELMRHQLAPFGVAITADKVHIEPYGGRDERVGWDTHLITIDGYGVWGMSDGPVPLSPEERRRERHQVLHELLDQVLAEYLAYGDPPPAKGRTSIYDPLVHVIAHRDLLQHPVDELLQAFFRSGHSASETIYDLMQWSYDQTRC